MVVCPFILPGHLLLGVVGFCDMMTLLSRHERGETPVQRRPLHQYSVVVYYIGRGLSPIEFDWRFNWQNVSACQQKKYHWIRIWT